MAHFVRRLVENEDDVVGLHTFLGGVNSLTEMVRRVFHSLLNESVDKSWNEKIKQFFGDHIKKVGLFGISLEFDASEKDLEDAVNNFASALRKIVEQLKEEKKRGLFLILDDINGLASSAEFAHWIKSLVDEVATSDKPLPLCLLIVGLDERRQALISHQPSLARVFDPIEINAWTKEETKTFFGNSFVKMGIDIEENVLDVLATFSGGLPVLAHEIGDAVFKVDHDKHIDTNDTTRGIINAAEIVGRKHLEPKVFQAICSKKYRTILRKVATGPFGNEFQRSKVLGHLNKGEQKVFDNFLNRMTELGVIVRSSEKGRGWYRFDNLLHYTYFNMEASRAEKGRKVVE